VVNAGIDPRQAGKAGRHDDAAVGSGVSATLKSKILGDRLRHSARPILSARHVRAIRPVITAFGSW
jgi:hypothetical protein